VGVQLRALGPVEAVVGGRLVDLGPPKQRALFGLLLSRVDRPVSVDALLEQLWSGAPPAAATASLQAYVSNLRRVLEPHRPPRAPAVVLRTRAPGYLLDSTGAEFDVCCFTKYADAGREALRRGDPQRALRDFEAGLALWRGQAYADVRDSAWVAPEVARLEELRLTVLEGRATALLELGAPEVAVAELESHVAAHPLREHGCELLALALYRSGRQADALTVLRATRTRLAAELGIDPGAALQQLQRDILSHAATLDRHRTTPRVPLPTPPPVSDRDVFVGREPALQRLADALATAARGRGQVVLVVGEPGIGKTRLLRQFAEQAPVPVAWGACPEHIAAPPLWPWEKVLHAVRAHCPDRPVPGPVAELLDGRTCDLDELEDVAGAALRRFEAIAQYLTANDSPMVVVLDDLHWADQSSLRLLAHLADTITASRLLVVATCWPHELGTSSGPLSATLAALARAAAVRIELSGLSRAQAQVLVVAVAGQQVDAHTAAILWARTEGNPFFLREMVGLLVSEQRLDEPAAAPVPVPVRDVVLRRVNRLPRDAVAVLSVAAIAGRHFCVDVVADAAAVDVEAALEAIDAAAAAGLVVENEQRLGWFSFTHALVAEALYTATGRLRGIRMHRRIAMATARAWTGDDERAAEIARHWSLAAELDQATAEQAAGYAAAAARVADARLAPEDAAARWRQALDAAELAGNRVDCYPLLLGLATSLYRAGHLQEGLPVFVHAMEQALDRDEPTRLITAALGAMGESNWYPVSYGVVDEGLVNVLDRALARLTDPTQRALALSCLAAARYYDDSPLRRAAQSDEALTLARGLADDLCLAHVLRLRAMALRTPDYPMQCLAAATELLGLPGLPPRVVAGARLLRADSLVILGRVPEAATEVELAALLVAQLRSAPLQTQLGWARASLLLLAGRWSQADARICATFDLHAPTRRFTALATRVAHRWEMAFLTGTGGDLIDDLRAAIDTTGVTALRSILAMALVEAGRAEDARGVLRRLAPRSKDYTWLYTQCWALLAAARLGDTDLVIRLRDPLLPYRRLACAASVNVISGSVAYFTAEAALALGDPDAALADLAIAVETDEAMGALPWLARARDATSRAQRHRQVAHFSRSPRAAPPCRS
ncbi:MAG: BTAD domain-containing putative transcriptional regulator, partial [Pseudonocardiaceae bacterium]